MENERIVQDALNQASKGRTILFVAHRLSTIREVDVIYVMHRGRIVEQGTHDELLARKGYFYRLTNAKCDHDQIK
jgi:ATP-binding cassette subfamily B protein